MAEVYFVPEPFGDSDKDRTIQRENAPNQEERVNSLTNIPLLIFSM